MREFIKNMLSAENNVSSKRVFGMLSIMYYYIIFASTYFIEITDAQIAMANQILYLGGTLLGLGLVEKFKKL